MLEWFVDTFWRENVVLIGSSVAAVAIFGFIIARVVRPRVDVTRDSDDIAQSSDRMSSDAYDPMPGPDDADDADFTGRVMRPESPKKPGSQNECRSTRSSRTSSVAKDSAIVDFAVFAPEVIASGSGFVVDVWVYSDDQYDQVLEKANRVNRSLNVGQSIGVSVPDDEVLGIKLEINGLQIDDPLNWLRWIGSPSNASFLVQVPSELTAHEFHGKALILCRGTTIAKVLFTLSVSPATTPGSVQRLGNSVRFQSAFASYASVDRAQVLSRIQGMKKIAPDLDVFIDVISLRSGERWQERLEQEVLSRDTLFLFWSKSASNSEWVEREWRIAFSRKGLDFINPVPLEEPSRVMPPSELSALHFGDAYLSYMRPGQ